MPRIVNPAEFADVPLAASAPGPRPVDPLEFEDDSISPVAVGAGALGLGALALAMRNPGMLKSAGQGVLDLRRMSMLSGLAPLKSLLGNIGGAAYSSIERGSLAPIRELLSPTTAKEAVEAFKQGAQYADAGPGTVITKANIPGRVMGAMDRAAQNALVRAGLSPEEAAREMLQAPLGKSSLTNALQDNPVADYLIPFRRTPFNQLTEGMASMKPTNLASAGQKAALATALGTGALAGATVDDPKALGLGTALSGRRGVPFAIGAAAGRTLRTGNKREGAVPLQGISPVSDYSLAEGVTKPFTDPLGSIVPVPAAVSAYATLKKWLGIE
jgi:hypothetical protein